ncbi:ATP-binding protein [Pseudoduganella ginsengisoli]|uniref:SpoIIE family protein phosphatase n=1 Tax=Pseudoduganella ginsengisoli TaxID=1462440 RepID=A0A6L6Q721_9BURK|nr:anti-sigma regulatory factor [Pseudoduganella ginsengisoli]MTW05239.1 SpoIIE family protein phosphatase [Pseudoduganella ginsengisoli]
MQRLAPADSVQLCCPVTDSSHVAAARRAATDLAARVGFDATRCGEAAIVATEAATNILKHAGHGEILLRALHSGATAGIELVAIDSGPGMASLPASMEDGRSTAGSYGVGLGAMARLSASLNAWSAPGQGAVFAMELWRGGAPPPPAPLELGVVSQALPGETECGDSWALACDATSATALVADGLGHGGDAAIAAQAAVTAVMARPTQRAAVLLEDAHLALRHTRGAAVSVVRIDMLEDRLVLAGIGNVACHAWLGSARRQLVSHNGIVGSNMRKVQEFDAPWGVGGMLILHSDGIGTRWNLDDYPGLAARHPAVIAAILYRDFCRKRDDATVLVVRDARGAA